MCPHWMPNNFFNLSISFRHSADVHRPYSRFIHRRSKKHVQNWISYDDHQNINLESFDITPLEERAKDIAWIASNCNAFNHREDFIQGSKSKQFLFWIITLFFGHFKLAQIRAQKLLKLFSKKDCLELGYWIRNEWI